MFSYDWIHIMHVFGRNDTCDSVSSLVHHNRRYLMWIDPQYWSFNFDHLVKALSTRFLHCSHYFPHCSTLCIDTLRLCKYLVSHQLSPMSFSIHWWFVWNNYYYGGSQIVIFLPNSIMPSTFSSWNSTVRKSAPFSPGHMYLYRYGFLLYR